MLNLASGIKIYVYTPVADMRKGINGLSGIVRDEFQSDPADGSLFVFINRRRDRMKLLHFEADGFWMYYRVLEAGTFETLAAKIDHVDRRAVEAAPIRSQTDLGHDCVVA